MKKQIKKLVIVREEVMQIRTRTGIRAGDPAPTNSGNTTVRALDEGPPDTGGNTKV